MSVDGALKEGICLPGILRSMNISPVVQLIGRVNANPIGHLCPPPSVLFLIHGTKYVILPWRHPQSRIPVASRVWRSCSAHSKKKLRRTCNQFVRRDSCDRSYARRQRLHMYITMNKQNLKIGSLLPYFSQTFAKSMWVFCRMTALTSQKFDHPEVGGPLNALSFEYCL